MKPFRIELPTEFDMGTVNVYLFTGPEPVPVDTGVKSEASWAALQAGLAEHSLAVADLSRVVISHPHVDHFGQAGRIATHSNAETWVADVGLPWALDFPAMWQGRMDFYREMFLRQLGFSPETITFILSSMTVVARDALHRLQENWLKPFD